MLQELLSHCMLNPISTIIILALAIMCIIIWCLCYFGRDVNKEKERMYTIESTIPFGKQHHVITIHKIPLINLKENNDDIDLFICFDKPLILKIVSNYCKGVVYDLEHNGNRLEIDFDIQEMMLNIQRCLFKIYTYQDRIKGTLEREQFKNDYEDILDNMVIKEMKIMEI